MPKECWKLQNDLNPNNQPTLVEICQDVHSSTVGSYDIDTNTRNKMIDILITAVDHWEPSNQDYDHAVLNLIKVTLDDAISQEKLKDISKKLWDRFIGSSNNPSTSLLTSVGIGRYKVMIMLRRDPFPYELNAIKRLVDDVPYEIRIVGEMRML